MSPFLTDRTAFPDLAGCDFWQIQLPLPSSSTMNVHKTPPFTQLGRLIAPSPIHILLVNFLYSHSPRPNSMLLFYESINRPPFFARCNFFLFILIFSSTYIHSITFIQYIHPSPIAEVPLHLLSSVGKPSWGAEPEIELGPALQQAEALSSYLLAPQDHPFLHLTERPNLLTIQLSALPCKVRAES
jgi:hypothetical protein